MASYEEKCVIPVDPCPCSGWIFDKCLDYGSRNRRGGFFLLPLLTTAFWMYLGRQYARRWRTVPALLIAHAVGFCSLLVYLWQFLLKTDETRNLTLAVSSQMFSASTPLYLFGGLARLVESQPNYAGRASMVAMQVIALIYMMMVFCIGIYLEKKNGIFHQKN